MRYSALAVLLASVTAAAPSAAAPPNIVVIVADDLGWADVGYHEPEIRSPNIDRLAATGVELDWHYVQPECTPTRVALLTGRYPSRFGNHCTQASNERALPFGTPTLASLLKDAGYETALCGKWHLGSKPEWGPNFFGFDHSYGSFAGAVGMFDHRYRLNRPNFARTWHRNHEYVDEEGHATDLVTREAVEWIGGRGEKPFFLYVPFQSVHVPIVEEQDWIDRNAHIESSDRRLFAAAVTHMDDCIGRIVDALERTGEREQTLIVFTSDNGGKVTYQGGSYPPPDPALTEFSLNHPLRGHKAQMYEGGIRVPAFANWPGRLDPRKLGAPLHAVDWLPTLAALVGFDPPAGDGRNVLPLLTGETAQAEPRTIYWVHGEQRQRAGLRHGDWKICRHGVDAKFELFNLAEDPYETTDLAASRPEKLAELKVLFEQEAAKDAPRS